MNTLSITKSDLKLILLMSSIIPVLSLISGFYIANSQANHGLHSAITTSHTRVIPNDASITAPAKDSSDKQPTGINKNISALVLTSIGKINHAPTPKRYIVQAGLFSDINNAKKLSTSLLRKELNSQIIEDNKNDKPFFRVIIGSFESEASAQSRLQEIELSHAIKLYLTAISSTKSSNFIAAL